MRSRITMEIDFSDQNKPVIQVSEVSSDDVRDKIVRSFRDTFGYTSMWCRVIFSSSVENEDKMYTIRPIPPQDILKEAEKMAQSYNDNFGKVDAISTNIVCYNVDQLSSLTQEQKNKAYNIILLNSDGSVTFEKMTKEKISLPGRFSIVKMPPNGKQEPYVDPMTIKYGPQHDTNDHSGGAMGW